MKKTLSFVLVLAIVFALFGCSAQTEEVTTQAAEAVPEETVTAAPAEPVIEYVDNKSIYVLYTNDVHCGVEDGIGYEGLAEIKSGLEASGNDVILADVGDAVQGDTIGTLSKGEYIIDIMNELGYDIATIGNHEFDYGMEQFNSNVERANFPYVACNFTGKDGNAILDPYVIIEAGGMKIAFIGIVTPQTLTTSTPTYFMNENGEYIYFFGQDETGETLYSYVQSAADAARAEGADYVVALSHLGTEMAASPWTSTEVIENTTGIDVFLDAHSHSIWEQEIVKNKDGNGVILSSTGTKLEYVGCLTINSDGTLSTALIGESSVGAFIDGINAQYDELVNTVVAHTDFDLVISDPVTGQRIIRNNETNLGDLCADAYRAMSGADVAIVNGGGIRTSIAAGDITYGQIIAVNPFGNSMCVVECTGAEILDALELSCSQMPSEYGGYLHVSGMTYTIDLTVPSPVVIDENHMFVKCEGEHRVKDVMIGGEPLELDKTYTLACHDYELKNMGDGYTMFTDNVYLQYCVMIDNQVLINYIVDCLGGVVGEEYSNPYGQGRVTVIQE